jgi:hypothetical protein
MRLESLSTKPRLLGHWVHRRFGSGSRLKQPNSPIGMIGQVLATCRVSRLDLNPLSVRRLVELLSKVVILHLEIVVLTKESYTHFITSLVWSV